MFWTEIFGSKLPSVDYCEKAISGIIARPEYFISNLSYLLVGIYLLTRKDKFGKVLGIISLIVGSFSAIYDASFRFNAQLLDLSAMFLLMSIKSWSCFEDFLDNTLIISCDLDQSIGMSCESNKFSLVKSKSLEGETIINIWISFDIKHKKYLLGLELLHIFQKDHMK